LRLVTHVQGERERDTSLRDQCELFQGSADAFAFMPPVTPSDSSLFNMHTGEFAIEERITYEFLKIGWRVFNPCRFVSLFHYHLESSRMRDSRNSSISMSLRAYPERAIQAPDPAFDMSPPRKLSEADIEALRVSMYDRNMEELHDRMKAQS
jgi:hypothetical protein